MATFDPDNKLSQLFTSVPFKIEGQWFLNKTLTLDGYDFVSCRFDGCTLFVTKGAFLIRNCFFSPTCSFNYKDEALRIVKLYGILATDAAKRWPNLAPTRNPDLTISII